MPGNSTDGTLYILSQRLNVVSSIDDLLKVIIEYPCQLGASSVAIFSAEPRPHLTSHKLHIIAQWSAQPEYAALHDLFKHIQADEGSLRCDTPLFVEDAKKREPNQSLDRILTDYGYRACVLIPLKVHQTWIGAICMVWLVPQAFDEISRNVLTAIGYQAAWVMYGVALHSQIQDRIRRTEVLLRLSTKLSQSNNEQDIVDAVGELVQNYAADTVYLSYIDDETLTVMARWTVTPTPLPKGLRFGKPRLIPDFLKKRMEHEEILVLYSLPPLDRIGFNAETVLVLPLCQGGWQGTIAINWQEKHSLTQEEEEIMRELIQVLRPIVSSRRAYLAQAAAIRESEQRAKELETVSKVSAAASQNLEFEQLLQTVVDLSQSSFNLYNAHIYLLDTPKQHLILAATSGETGRAMKAFGITKLLLARDPSVAARCARTKEGIIVNDVTKRPEFIPNPLLPEVRSEMAVPMLLDKQLIGVLNLQSKEINHFNDNVLLVMRALADEIAVAVRNVDLYQRQRSVAEELRKLDQLKSQFLANMSHELRTPLNAIRNFTYFVSSGLFGPVNERQIDALGKVTLGTNHLLGLINDILDFSKIEAGMMQLYPEEVDLNSLLESVFATVNGLPRSERVDLITEVETALPSLRGDKQRLKQILLNLLSNALKFTKEGSITLSVRRERNELLFTVRDTGPGIAPDDQTTIFEAFRQSSEGVGNGGTGLGLPISKHLAEAHGGRLWMTSKLHEGSTFYLALPLTNTHEKYL